MINMERKFIRYVFLRLGVLLLLFYTFAFLVYKANAAEYYTSGMVGVFNSGKNSFSETKLLNFGIRDSLLFGLSEQLEAGGWVDSVGNGRRSSAYGAYQVGIEATRGLTLRVMVGPALVTSPDSYLGGPFQMTEEFFLGIKGTNENSVGLKYKHFSSGGIETPNVGRDFSGVEAGITF